MSSTDISDKAADTASILACFTVSRPWRINYLEEGHGGATVHGAVLDGCLICQIVHRLDGNVHPLDSEEGSQVSRVGRDDDKGEGPPVHQMTEK